MKKVIALSLSFVMLLGVLASCSDQKTEETTTAAATTASETMQESPAETAFKPFYEFTDAYGNDVVIETEPQRIVSVSPVMTEIVYALGKGDKLVGRTVYCDYPEEAASLPTIGDIYSPDVEAIVALEPDLVLTSSIFSEESFNQLTELGYNVAIVIDEESFEGIYDVISTVGNIVGAPDEAAALIEDIKAEVDQIVNDKVDSDISVYYCMGCGEYGEYTAGGDTFINDIIELAGAKNAAADAKGWTYSLEALIAADPDYVLISAWAYDEFTTSENYADLKAVKNGNVIIVDSNLFERQGPRIVEGLKLVHELVLEAAAEEAQAA